MRDSNTQFRQLIGLYPERHGILASCEDLRPADSIGAADGGVEVDVRIVREKRSVAGAVGRVYADQHARSRGRLSQANPIARYLGRKLTVCQLLSRLRNHEILVGISLGIKIGD